MKNCRLKKVNFKDVFGNRMHGFVLMSKDKTFEFYSVSQSETTEWIDALKSYVILLDLKEEFTIGKILGKGNSAKVHRCERKSDPTQS